jgi:hypothetical protein
VINLTGMLKHRTKATKEEAEESHALILRVNSGVGTTMGYCILVNEYHGPAAGGDQIPQ